MDAKMDVNETLREAVCMGNIQSVNKLIQMGASVNSQNTVNGWTALHWAAKRNNSELVEYLLNNGADPSIKSFEGDTPSNLTSDKKILQVLPCDSATNEKHSLPILPNYLQNPSFPYNDMTQSVQQSSSKVDSIANDLSELHLSTSHSKLFLVKVRIADSGEPDFVEVDVNGISYHDLLKSCCEELEVHLEEVSKLRKLPNILIRKDRDVARLDNGQELELVLKGGAISTMDRN